MNVLATVRQFFVAIVILLCAASAEAFSPRNTSIASAGRDMIHRAENQSLPLGVRHQNGTSGTRFIFGLFLRRLMP
jgi:hypothetical protein